MSGTRSSSTHVWKKFRRGERHDSLRDLVPATARRRARAAVAATRSSGREFWALRGRVVRGAPGQALGIIGPNGAGKSTMLKLLRGSCGRRAAQAAVHGRVGALIEVAAGFHPDLTGRENIYLQGAIIGMKRAEIARKFDEIVEFAGVGDFIDTPVKRYSSGMNARLGFSIAAHLDPDVLIIDEVLSVGDTAFQAALHRADAGVQGAGRHDGLRLAQPAGGLAPLRSRDLPQSHRPGLRSLAGGHREVTCTPARARPADRRAASCSSRAPGCSTIAGARPTRRAPGTR